MSRRSACLLACILVLSAIVLAGCGDGTVISESSAGQSFFLSCERLSSSRDIAIPVGDSAAMTLNASVARSRGSLSVLISDGDGEVVYSGSDIASATSFTLMLEGPAEYSVHIETDGFTGSVELTWEIVGASAAEPPANTDTPVIQQPEGEAVPNASEPAVSDDVVITNTLEPEQTPSDAQPGEDEIEIPEWNGQFENADAGIMIELFWADNNTVEFQVSGIGSIVTATARIDGASPDTADYSYGDEMALSFTLTGQSLIVTQTGTCSLIPLSIAGEYQLVES